MPQPNKKPLAAIVGTAAAAILAVCIPHFEGTRLTPYQDTVKVWTSCTGNTHNVTPGVKLTPAQCKAIDDANLAQTATDVAKCEPLEGLTAGQRAAIVSLSFNIGTQAFCKSTFAAKLRVHDPSACKEILRFTYAGGKFSQGLYNRRLDEVKICETKEL